MECKTDRVGVEQMEKTVDEIRALDGLEGAQWVPR
jgi:hypothetical protein